MKLLILTQKVDINDDILGFFHSWINEFAKHCEQVTVIAMGVGEYVLSENVKILSLGKENFSSVIPAQAGIHSLLYKIKYFFRFYLYIWQERKNYDTVFVHMNPEYVIMGGLFWRLTGKKVGLWYVHKQIGVILRIAEKIAHVIFTASRESFRLPSKKLQIVGHGIDMERFKPQTARPIGKDFFRIICIGRISPIKNQDLLIEALNILVNRDGIKNIKAGLIGAPIYPKDKDYQKMLAEKVSRYRLNDYLDFRGSVPNIKMPEIYQTADLSVNLGQTGGMDKTVLESLASGIPAVVLDKTFSDLFGDDAATFILSANSAAELADKIKKISMNKPQIRHLSDKVRDNFSTGGLVGRIIKILTAVNL